MQEKKIILCPWCGTGMELRTSPSRVVKGWWEAWFSCPHCKATSRVAADDNIACAIEKVFKSAWRCEQIEPCNRDKWPELWAPALDMTAEERLKYIWEIALDWDGARTAKHLGELVDEIIAYCAAPLSKTCQHRPLTREEAESLPVGTLYYSEHKPPFEDDSYYAEINFENEYAGDGYGRVYRYWLHRPNEKEKVEFEWE